MRSRERKISSGTWVAIIIVIVIVAVAFISGAAEAQAEGITNDQTTNEEVTGSFFNPALTAKQLERIVTSEKDGDKLPQLIVIPDDNQSAISSDEDSRWTVIKF